MAYTLENLVTDFRQTLENSPDKAGSSALCPFVEKALGDEDFLKTHFGPDKPGPRHIIYEDPDYGFCVCVHVYHDAKGGEPHDHGPSWAIYGQAEGVTTMSHWRITEPGSGDKPTLVEQVDTLVMKPGMSHFYAVGDVHAPYRDDKVKLLRIEGANLDNITRSNIKPVDAPAA